MRGEDLTSHLREQNFAETPPHARGRLVFLDLQREGLRNTPACAGKTCSRALARYSISKHPRMRGEDLPWPQKGPGVERNTPACAGKTEPPIILDAWFEKHPRMRGEDKNRHHSEKARIETPPHARGRPFSRRRAENKRRNTPACAGKTRGAPPVRVRRKKHPRMRGEDHLGSDEKHTRGGNTPACAGKTRGALFFVAFFEKHPRMRGEDSNRLLKTPGCLETPPHARGRPLIKAHGYMGAGNTPACAGKTPQ